MSQVHRARVFRGLHSGQVLVLPNAWDAASARLIEQAGAAAIATTSAGVSWSLGVPDGEQLDRGTAITALARVTEVVQVPVTADIEGGYHPDPDGLAEVVRQVISTGAVGVNLEDAAAGTLRDVQDQSARISAVRRAAADTTVDLFVNARIDTYLLRAVDADQRLVETVSRAEEYLAAGADGIFVPGVVEAATIAKLASSIDAPLNVMMGPGGLTVGQLADLGVARVSVGMAIAQAAYALTRSAAAELLTAGTSAQLSGGLGYDELNALLTRDA